MVYSMVFDLNDTDSEKEEDSDDEEELTPPAPAPTELNTQEEAGLPLPVGPLLTPSNAMEEETGPPAASMSLPPPVVETEDDLSAAVSLLPPPAMPSTLEETAAEETEETAAEETAAEEGVAGENSAPLLHHGQLLVQHSQFELRQPALGDWECPTVSARREELTSIGWAKLPPPQMSSHVPPSLVPKETWSLKRTVSSGGDDKHWLCHLCSEAELVLYDTVNVTSLVLEPRPTQSNPILAG